MKGNLYVYCVHLGMTQQYDNTPNVYVLLDCVIVTSAVTMFPGVLSVCVRLVITCIAFSTIVFLSIWLPLFTLNSGVVSKTICLSRIFTLVVSG